MLLGGVLCAKSIFVIDFYAYGCYNICEVIHVANRTETASRTAFAQNLRSHIERTGKNRKTISQELGVSYSTFTDWCVGRKYPRIEKLESLAAYFGTTVPELVGESKNDVAVGTKDETLELILQMHKDPEFLSFVKKASQLNRDQLSCLSQFFDTIVK